MELTDAELTILGLLVEQTRHGYDIEQTIRARGIREWTAVGFSSIYYLLSKLEQRGLAASSRRDGKTKERRIYRITRKGREACAQGAASALAELRPMHPPVLLGMANSPLLSDYEVIAALEERARKLDERLGGVHQAQRRQQPLPLFVDAIFDYSLCMLKAEQAWVTSMLHTWRNKNDGHRL